MNGRRAIVGLCMLCALLLSAIAAQGASAANGITAFTCSSSASVKDFKTEHCVPGETGTAFGHVAITEGETTHITLSSAKTNAATNGPTATTFKSTVAGSPIELVSENIDCKGGMRNLKDGVTSEHYIEVHALTCTYSEVKEKNLGCTVTGLPEAEEGGKEMIMTKPLKATTKGGTEESIVLSPVEGTKLAEFELTGCVVGPLKVPVFGTITCKASGATINCKHEEVTAKKTMRVLNATTGPLAGYEGKATVTGGKEPVTEPTSPISVTTVT
ncbi:MAG: hypothetical protein ACOYD4_18410 [Solirubrobacterales bacterium]